MKRTFSLQGAATHRLRISALGPQVIVRGLFLWDLKEGEKVTKGHNLGGFLF